MELFNETSVITFSCPWEVAVKAVTDPNGGAFPVPGFAAAGYQDRAGLVPAGTILMATEPFPGSVREREVFDDDDVEIIKDPCGGAWEILTPENLQWATYGSARSGSTIEIERVPDADVGGEWSVTAEFPVNDGVRYQGVYWDAIQAALAALAEIRKGESD